jgi:hypothetical protein
MRPKTFLALWLSVIAFVIIALACVDSVRTGEEIKKSKHHKIHRYQMSTLSSVAIYSCTSLNFRIGDLDVDDQEVDVIINESKDSVVFIDNEKQKRKLALLICERDSIQYPDNEKYASYWYRTQYKEVKIGFIYRIKTARLIAIEVDKGVFALIFRLDNRLDGWI